MPLATDHHPRPTATLRVWVDGHLYDDPAEARVSATDHGLVVGDGVFEGIKVTRDGAFAVRRHLARLDRSAAALALPTPDHRLIRSAIDELLDAQALPLGLIRLTYTGGRGPLGSGAAYGPPTLVVALGDAQAPSPSTTIVTTPWSRNERGALTGVKTTSYAENVRSLAYAVDRGAGEALLLNTAGQVCEGTGSNVFVVVDGTVVTPPLSAGPLAGITRELLLEWWPVQERNLTPAQAHAADEVFLASTLRDVQPVTCWDDTRFGAHPVTDAVSRHFGDRAGADPDP